jgi:hypothetical protein
MISSLYHNKLLFNRITFFIIFIFWLFSVFFCQTKKSNLKIDIETAKWISIFNGKDLNDWKITGSGKWEVEDGVIVGNASSEGQSNGWLMTKKGFQNFHLRVKFQISENGKGGLCIRCAEGTVKEPSGGGYLINIDFKDETAPTGSIMGVARAYEVYERFPDKISWHKLEVWAEGDRFIVFVDNDRVAEGFSRKSFFGSIGFQISGSETTLKIKEISLLELSSQTILEPTIEEQLENATGEWRSLFNGKDLTGWKQPYGKPAKWLAKDGLLTVSPGGEGWLFYYDEDFSDFIFKLSFKVGEKSNSGAAYRFNFSNGDRLPSWYKSEVQIIGNDNIRTPDGTGAIYSLTRNNVGLMKPGEEWNELKIYALGPHIATYVNGKKAAESFNTATLKGAVGVSAHDPTAYGQFKDIQIKPVEW